MTIKYNYVFIKFLPISIIVFLLIFYGLISVKGDSAKEIQDNNPVAQINKIESQDKLIADCLKNQKSFYGSNYLYFNCGDVFQKMGQDKLSKPQFKKLCWLKLCDLYESNWLILIIYALLVLCLNVQLSLYFYIKGKRDLSEQYLHLSDWAINSPPMLGVIGTVVSFALLMGDSGVDGIQAIFTHHFFDAVITTIIGGVFYIINLFLKINIYPAIKR